MRKSWILIFLITALASPSLAGWTPAVRISDEALAYDPRIAANGDTIHVVYWSGGAFTSSYYLRSEDGGDTWWEPFHLADTTHTSNNVMPIIRSEGNKIAVIWRGDIRGGGTQLNYGFRLSTDYGIYWNDVEYVLPDDQDMLQKHAFCISDSKLFFIYSYWSQEIIVKFRKSTDWGETWTEPTEIFRTEQTGRFDMAARGDSIHFIWVGRFDYDHEWEVYHIRSTDWGESWSENVILSTPDHWGTLFPSISANSRGDIVICWMDYKDSPYFITGDIFLRYSFDGGESWTEEQQLTDHHLVFPVRVLWSGDSVHVAWEDWRHNQDDIFYRLSTDNGITWADEERVEDDPGESGYPDIAISGDKVHLVWNDFREDPGYGIYYSRREEIVAVDNEDEQPLTGSSNLKAHPNPFNSSTTITYSGLEKGEINVYNIAGQKIRTITTTSKEGKIIWDARDALGNKVSSGIYFARVRNGSVGTRAPQNSTTLKLIYLK